MPPNSSPTFTLHTPTSLVQLLVYKPCSVSHSYYSVLFCSRKEKNLLLLNYSCSDSTAFCIASISSAPNSPISANQSCSSDSSDSSDSPTRYNPSMPSCRSSISLQIISTRHFSQRCCAINSSCFFTIPFMMVSIQPNLSDTVSSSSASSDSTSVSLSFPLPFASSSVFFLRFTRSDPVSAVPQPFFIAMHLSHEVLLPSLLKSAVKSREHWMFTYLLQTHSLPAFTHLQQLLFSTSSSENPLFFSCDPDASCGSASPDHPCLSASRLANSARILCRSSTLSELLSSECCICGWLWSLWFKLCIPTNPQVQLYIPTDHVHTLRPQGSALRGKYCHIPYLTSNLSSPTLTFRTYLRPLLRRYSTLVLLTPFRCYATIIIVSLHFYFPYCPLSPIVPYCLHTLLLPTCILTCILTCNIRALLSLLFIP